MTKAADGERDAALWAALQRRVCSLCLDVRDDGSCSLSGACALESHRGPLLQAIAEAPRDSAPALRAAIERRVCAVCVQGSDAGACARHGRGECAVLSLLPLVLEAVAEAGPPREPPDPA